MKHDQHQTIKKAITYRIIAKLEELKIRALPKPWDITLTYVGKGDTSSEYHFTFTWEKEMLTLAHGEIIEKPLAEKSWRSITWKITSSTHESIVNKSSDYYDEYSLPEVGSGPG